MHSGCSNTCEWGLLSIHRLWLTTAKRQYINPVAGGQGASSSPALWSLRCDHPCCGDLPISGCTKGSTTHLHLYIHLHAAKALRYPSGARVPAAWCYIHSLRRVAAAAECIGRPPISTVDHKISKLLVWLLGEVMGVAISSIKASPHMTTSKCKRGQKPGVPSALPLPFECKVTTTETP